MWYRCMYGNLLIYVCFVVYNRTLQQENKVNFHVTNSVGYLDRLLFISNLSMSTITWSEK